MSAVACLLLSMGYLRIPPRATARGPMPAARVRQLRVYPQLSGASSTPPPPPAPPTPPRANINGFGPDEGPGKALGDLLAKLFAAIWEVVPGGVLTKIILSVSACLFTWATSIFLTWTRVDKRLVGVNETLGTKIDMVNESLSTKIETLSTKIDSVNKTLSTVITKMDNIFTKTDALVLSVVLLCVPSISRLLQGRLPFRIQVVMKPDTAHSPSPPPPPPPPVASAVP
jgi:hypothetical protein